MKGLEEAHYPIQNHVHYVNMHCIRWGLCQDNYGQDYLSQILDRNSVLLGSGGIKEPIPVQIFAHLLDIILETAVFEPSGSEQLEGLCVGHSCRSFVRTCAFGILPRDVGESSLVEDVVLILP